MWGRGARKGRKLVELGHWANPEPLTDQKEQRGVWQPVTGDVFRHGMRVLNHIISVGTKVRG